MLATLSQNTQAVTTETALYGTKVCMLCAADYPVTTRAASASKYCAECRGVAKNDATRKSRQRQRRRLSVLADPAMGASVALPKLDSGYVGAIEDRWLATQLVAQLAPRDLAELQEVTV